MFVNGSPGLVRTRLARSYLETLSKIISNADRVASPLENARGLAQSKTLRVM